MAFQDEANSAASRLHLGRMQPPMLVGAAAVAVLVVAVIVGGAVQAASAEGFAVMEADQPRASDASAVATSEEESGPVQLCVYVSGAVARADVYFLDDGSRVADAIAAAGGFTDEAAVGSLNLARLLNDGEQIAVPVETPTSAVGAGEGSTAATGTAGPSTATAGGLVNINSADSAALQTLDGVGEATAKKIIADREANGPFRTIEDLKRVSGIGDKKFANLRDSICV